jgi:hypothetical protein
MIKIAHNMALKNIAYLFLPVCLMSGFRGGRGDQEQLYGYSDTQRLYHGKGVFRISGSLQRMHSYAKWIGENIGAKSSRARTSLADSRGIGSDGVNDETLPQGWPITAEQAS